jgi:serine protease Do
MTADLSASKGPRRVLTARRVVLFASVAAVAGGLMLQGPSAPKATFSPFASLVTPARADGLPRPVGFADIVDKVKPSVISVRVKMNAQGTDLGDELQIPKGSPFEFFFRRFGSPDGDGSELPRGPHRRQFTTGQGSGFIISSDGYAVTNNHVVDKAESVEVTADDGKTYTAKVIGTDPRTDLALIKIDGRNDFPTVKLSDQTPRVGDWVIAVGNPFGLGGSVTAGIVSARGRDIGAGPYDDFIQIDAPVNKGNSGGPTFDVDGNVIGVNTAIFSPSGGSVGIAFAIPAETVRSVVAQLRDKGSVTRGWIGVQIQPVTPEIADSLGIKKAEGALVAEPQSGSPAAKAGVKAGDIILSVNGDPVKDARGLARTISAMAPGTSVKLGILRDGKEDTVTLTLGELPKERQARAEEDHPHETASSELPKLGLSLAPANKVSGYDGDGVVVTNVDPSGPAADHGFKTGDVILEVSGKTVSTPADVNKAIGDAHASGKRAVLMRVKSGDATKFVALPLDNA